MRQRAFHFNLLFALAALMIAPFALAQAPSSIQMFMPDGALVERPIRFTLTRDDGRVETLFTDTKGKFLITGDLVRDADYIVTIDGDGRTFGTTVATFRTFRNTIAYVPVFLKPLEEKKRNPPGVLDVTDVNVPPAARSAYQQAMEEVGKGENEKAISDLQRALDLYPRYLRALNDVGVLYLQMNRLDEAATTFKRAIKIDQSFLYPRLNLGIVLNRQGKHAEAAEMLGKLYQENPQLSGAQVPYAEALAETGKLPEAGKVMNRENRFAEAAAELEKAIKLEPNTVMAHLQLGGALIQLKRLSEAERELLKAYELGGASAGAAQFLLGQVYYLELKYELAMRAFEQYLKDVPNGPNAGQVGEAIEKIKAVLKQK